MFTSPFGAEEGTRYNFLAIDPYQLQAIKSFKSFKKLKKIILKLHIIIFHVIYISCIVFISKWVKKIPKLTFCQSSKCLGFCIVQCISTKPSIYHHRKMICLTGINLTTHRKTTPLKIEQNLPCHNPDINKNHKKCRKKLQITTPESWNPYQIFITFNGVEFVWVNLFAFYGVTKTACAPNSKVPV